LQAAFFDAALLESDELAAAERSENEPPRAPKSYFRR
jgi:hypothetical protein